jgi:hypothetical protein
VLGLASLFYPWGFLVQIAAIIHFWRRRPEGFWLFVIFFGGFIGATAYLLVEALPDVGLLRDGFQRFGRRSRIQTLEAQVLDNPSVGNLEELGELLFDQKEYAKAREVFTQAIAARSDSPHTFYQRALASLALGDLASAIPDLEHVVRSDSRFDYYRAAGLLADAYASTGQLDRAAALFAEVTQYSTTAETLYNYAHFLKLQGRGEEAREWTQKLLAKQRSLPRYMVRRERPWFRKGKSLLKDLSAV